MNATQILVISGPYTQYGKVALYLSEDGRYNVTTLPMDEVSIENLPEVNLCIIEWTSNPKLYQILDRYNETKAKSFMIVNKKNLTEYAVQPARYQPDFTLLPVSREELILRVAQTLSIRARPQDEGMTMIDEHLSINFDTCIARVGVNSYRTLTFSSILLLARLFESINHWLGVSELLKSFHYQDNLRESIVSSAVYNARRCIEDNPKRPRYLLTHPYAVPPETRYMLRSENYPEGDYMGFFKKHRHDR